MTLGAGAPLGQQIAVGIEFRYLEHGPGMGKRAYKWAKINATPRLKSSMF